MLGTEISTNTKPLPPFNGAGSSLTWLERIESYRGRIGIPYLGHENGWTFGTWFIGNSYEVSSAYQLSPDLRLVP